MSVFGGARAAARRGSAALAAVPPGVAAQGGAAAAGPLAPRPSADLFGAFGTPVPWLAPLLCLAVFGGIPFVQTMAFFGFVYALMRALQRGLAGATAGEVVTASLFLFAMAAVLSAIVSVPGVPADGGAWTGEHLDGGGPAPDASGAYGIDTVMAAAAPLRASVGEALTDVDVDARPSLEDPALVEALLTARVPPALQDDGSAESLALDLFVREDGTVDPDSTHVASASHPALAGAAAAVAPRIRFRPMTVRAVPAAAWVTLEVWFVR